MNYKNIGVNDQTIDLFEGQYIVKNGMRYNSYVIIDEKIAIMDTVDARFLNEWLDNLELALNGKKPDYLIVSHMEPDHSGSIASFMRFYPDVKIVATAKAFTMLKQFYGKDYTDRGIVVNDKDTLSLGKHTLIFITAPMIHWPEVMVTYDDIDKVLYSADAFGKFGDNLHQEKWEDEARRYYFGIIGKYGGMVQTLFKKLSSYDIETIASLHGPILDKDINKYMALYNTWSLYEAEEDGIVIAYCSIYGNTKKAVWSLYNKLRSNNCKKIVMYDLARCDIHQVIADSFRYSKLVLASVTYNGDIFPYMKNFIDQLLERSYQNRKVAIIENGSWAPMASKIIKRMFEESKNIEFIDPIISIKSSLSSDSVLKLDELAYNLCVEYLDNEREDKQNLKSLFNIGYGLYVLITNDGKRDNGMIVNTVCQVTSMPNRIAVTINKDNYSFHTVMKTKIMNVSCLSIDAPFSIFEKYGFVSGRNVNKLNGENLPRSNNNLPYLDKYANSYMSLKVEEYYDLGTHGMFIASIDETKILSKEETMTYAYYQKNVKPKPSKEVKKGWVCKICGYVYEGEELPPDFICPVCKHGASDFERIK